MDRDAFAKAFDVSRETMRLFDRYAELLIEWQARMNLVGPSTLSDIWGRHFADSAQLLPIAGVGRSWLDIGSGAGFPGLVVALLDPDARIMVVESITKKCRFLSAAAAELDLMGQVRIENRRIEALPEQKFEIVTARALAPLNQLLDWALPFAGSGTKWVLPKGARVQDEIAAAAVFFRFDYDLVPSQTDTAARIMVVSGVKRR